jgi:hypothetical protein
MKQITRRLYTKPVMLAMVLLAGMALLVGLLVTTERGQAVSGFPVPAGNDEFETDGDGETFHNFGGSPVPEHFFGPGSQPYNQLVALVGVPLAAGSNVDTIIQRHQSVSAPGGSTPLTMTGLSLKSITPITVNYTGGGSETWEVYVGLSLFKSSTGSMTINTDTFDSTLKVWPKFTFKRVPDGKTLELDTGNPDSSGLTAAATASEFDDGGTISNPDEPVPLPAPCPVATDEFKVISSDASATASSSCPPVTLTSTGSPWKPGCGGICFPVPPTEEERWARHRPRPKPSPVIIRVQQGTIQ